MLKYSERKAMLRFWIIAKSLAQVVLNGKSHMNKTIVPNIQLEQTF